MYQFLLHNYTVSQSSLPSSPGAFDALIPNTYIAPGGAIEMLLTAHHHTPVSYTHLTLPTKA